MCNAFCCRSNSSKYTPKCSIPLLLEINVLWTQTQLFFIAKQLKKTKHTFKLLQNKNTLFSLLYFKMCLWKHLLSLFPKKIQDLTNLK